jgi:hypothetical protein
MTDENRLRKELDAALAEVAAAEEALDAVLRALGAGVRAEKIAVTETVHAAFVRLQKARAAMGSARALVGEQDEVAS